MEYTAYFPGIAINERQSLCGLNLFDAGGCMAAQAEDSSDRLLLYHHATILRAYFVLQAWRQEAYPLLKAAGKPLVYVKPKECRAGCRFSEFTDIRSTIDWDGAAVSWMASALTETRLKSRYLSLYYALKELSGRDLEDQLAEWTTQQNFNRFYAVIDCLQLDEEACGEQGIEYQPPYSNQALFERFLHIWDMMHRRYREERP